MNVLNKENLKSILKPFKEKMDSCITEEQLKSELDNYVTEDNATINNSLSIKNNDNDTIATLSAEQDSVKLSIGDNIMALNTDGELLVNNVNVLSNNNSNTLEYDEMTIDSPYTKNKDIPYAFVNGSVVAVGNNIYLLGGNNSSNYKYNISDYSGKIKFKKSDHYIYTDKLKYYTSNESQLIYLDDDEIYVEYDKNNNLIKNNFTPDIDGKMNIYVRTGAKLNGKSLPGSGWQTINVLDYI